MTEPRTAIIWGPDDLLTRAMEKFLTAGQSWKVTRIPASEEICSLVDEVQNIRPDLLVLNREKCGDGSDPLMSLFQQQPELKILADLPKLKLILVNLEDNTLQVYSKDSVTVKQVSDWLAIIENRHYPDHPVQKEVKCAGKND